MEIIYKNLDIILGTLLGIISLIVGTIIPIIIKIKNKKYKAYAEIVADVNMAMIEAEKLLKTGSAKQQAVFNSVLAKHPSIDSKVILELVEANILLTKKVNKRSNEKAIEEIPQLESIK